MTRVTVIGAGVVGAAAAWALTVRGAEVTIHEQFELGHGRGSSHGRTRIVRLAYPDPAWVRLAADAREDWRRLEEESGRTLLSLVGLVELAASPGLTSQAGLAACGVEHRLLTPAEARLLGVALPAGWCALYEPGGGFVRADLACTALLDAARGRGARILAGSRVESLGELDADVIVVAAGAWVRDLVPDVPVRITRETLAYFRREGPPLPSVGQLSEDGSGHLLYALHDPVYGVKAGAHHGGGEADPHEPGLPDEQIVERVAAWVRERLPGVDPNPVAAETCLYTTTPGETFVLERRGRLVVASACSGHGFKFAPLVGERVAELVLG